MKNYSIALYFDKDMIFINIVDDLHYNLITEELQRYKVDEDYIIIRDNFGKCHYYKGGKQQIQLERLEMIYG